MSFAKPSGDNTSTDQTSNGVITSTRAKSDQSSRVGSHDTQTSKNGLIIILAAMKIKRNNQMFLIMVKVGMG
jgi:hypothetical protein